MYISSLYFPGSVTTWIGAYRAANGQNKWAWYDGTAWDYTLWRSGEPNNAGGTEDFVARYSSGPWNDVPLHWKFAFVCQAPSTLGNIIN